MKAVVAAFNQEKALVGAFSVITNLRMKLFQALLVTVTRRWCAHKYAGSLTVAVSINQLTEQRVYFATTTLTSTFIS